MNNSLFTNKHVGNFDAKNRVVMAPMTRSRTEQPGDVPTDLISPLTKSVSSDSICSSSFMRKLTDVDEATVCGSGRPYRGVV